MIESFFMPKNIFYFVTICTKKALYTYFLFSLRHFDVFSCQKKHLCRFLEKALARFCLFRCFYVVVRGERRKKPAQKNFFPTPGKKKSAPCSHNVPTIIYQKNKNRAGCLVRTDRSA